MIRSGKYCLLLFIFLKLVFLVIMLRIMQSSIKQNKAWLLGVYMGNSALNGWGTWKVSSYYKVLKEIPGWILFPNDDFYSGDTDTKGWQSEIDIGLAKNVWFDMLYYHTNIFKNDQFSVSKLSLIRS